MFYKSVAIANDNLLGSEFEVFYSVKNPKNSIINLGMFEKCKTTVDFIKFAAP